MGWDVDIDSKANSKNRFEISSPTYFNVLTNITEKVLAHYRNALKEVSETPSRGSI